MQRTLGDIDPQAETLEDLLITLPICRHVFTVETLDGHCELHEYYRRDSSTYKWIGLEAPPPGFKKPPVCPTCRAAITAPRYGRVFKRADLDILENNVAFHMSKSLKTVHAKLDTVSKNTLKTIIEEIGTQIKPASLKVSTKELKSMQRTQSSLLQSTRTTPFALLDIDPLNGKLHGLPIEEARVWKKIALALFAAYKDTSTAAQVRSAHSHAWEAAFSYLYQKELDDVAANPSTAPRNPHEYAMRIARLKVGQPQPRADMRFLVEAFWATITIRLTLVELANAWLDAVAGGQTSEYPAANRRIWATYISFLLRSCAADVQRALAITRASESRRQEARTVLFLLRIELEQFRFNVQMTKQASDSARTSAEKRNKLADSAAEKRTAAREHIAAVRARPHGTGGLEWLVGEFVQPAQAIVDDWKALERSLRLDTFYQPVSHEELTQIVKGLDFCESHSLAGVSSNVLISYMRSPPSAHGSFLQVSKWPHLCDRRRTSSHYGLHGPA